MSSVAHDSQRTALGGNGPVSESEYDRPCTGCNDSIGSDTGGVAVQFGNSLWHVDCFKCAKCRNQVYADIDLLLLSDGSPICPNCYNCNVCKKPISVEAIVTGDDTFHPECFTCRSCKNQIDELVFAKTSKGIYCMKCHNERVARSRRVKEEKREREREKERAALVSSAGRSISTTSEAVSVSGQRENEHATRTISLVIEKDMLKLGQTKPALDEAVAGD